MLFIFCSRETLLHYGVWDQVRVDHGNEFYLVLFVQEMLKLHRNNNTRQSYVQTQSKQVSNDQSERRSLRWCQLASAQIFLLLEPCGGMTVGGNELSQ